MPMDVLDEIYVLLGDNTKQAALLRERALKHPKLVSIKPQLPSTLGPLRVQEHLQRVLLQHIERPAMHRHIRVQQSAKKNTSFIHSFSIYRSPT
jgi:hypothetical protein